MTYRVTCTELGIPEDDTVFTGETPEDIVEAAIDHLRDEHDVDMPDKEVILVDTFSPLEEMDEQTILIVRRLRQKLNIDPAIA